MEKWVCLKCGREQEEKPTKNSTCDCGGRFRHYKKCKGCGEWFYDQKYSRTKCDRCSHTAGHERKGTVVLVCRNCGVSFRRYAGNVRSNAHYCSKKCFEESRKTQKLQTKCEFCGAGFEVYVSSVRSSNAAGRFCSTQCYHESMTLDKERNYRGFREAKRKHFNGVQFCAICGATKNINIHHIVPNRITHDQSAKNLIPLCNKHHPQIEKATRAFIDAMDGEIEMAGELLNLALRERQMQTFAMLKTLASKK